MIVSPKSFLKSQYGITTNSLFVKLMNQSGFKFDTNKKLLHQCYLCDYMDVELLDDMPEEDKQAIRNNEAILLLDFSGEYHNQIAPGFFNYIHNALNKNNLDANKTLVFVGNCNLISEYEEFKRFVDTPFHIFHAHVLFTTVLNAQDDLQDFIYPDRTADVFAPPRWGDLKLTEFSTPFEEMLKYKKQHNSNIKTFNLLQQSIRPHREITESLLKKENLWDNNLCSFMEKGVFLEHEKERILKAKAMPRGLEQQTERVKIFFDREVYTKSWLTVVSEAGVSDDYCGVTEKIFWTAHSVPSITIGPKGCLEHLRQIGFKTFDKYFDECYDKLPFNDRLHEILKLIKKIDAIPNKLEWYESMQEVLEHNYYKSIELSAVDSSNKYLHDLFTRMNEVIRRI